MKENALGALILMGLCLSPQLALADGGADFDANDYQRVNELAVQDDPLAYDLLLSIGSGLGGLGEGGSAMGMGTRLGYRAGEHTVFGTFSHDSVDQKSDWGDYSQSLMTLGAGYRYSLSMAEEQVATPYLVTMAYTAMPKSKTDGAEDESDISILGFVAGVGAEFTISGTCSLSGEFGAHRLAITNNDEDATVTYLRTYSSIAINFYL
jgi:hypothetical protein